MKNLLFLFISFSSCVNHEKNIIIRGEVKNIPSKKVYLTDAYKWQIFLDSADYKNDTFSFHLNPEKFEPFLASICFIDSEGKSKLLAYQNYILATNDHKYALTCFVLDKGITTITGKVNNIETIRSDKLKITASKQNEPLFKTQFIGFGEINTNNTEERSKIINGYKDLIKEYPYSYYFIKILFDSRTRYTKEELVDMLALFDNDEEMQHFKQKFSTYFNDMPSSGKPLHNYTLKDFLDQPKNIINSSKLNMIIFWASWCGPCRKEIPELKKVYAKFKNSGMRMVSVSIDEDKAMWKLAVQKENMDWEQLIVDSLLHENVKSSFNFSNIPLIIFTDRNGLEITRFTGYEPGNKNEYNSIIEKYIK